MEEEELEESDVVMIKLINETDIIGSMVAITEETISLSYPLEVISGYDEQNHPFAALKAYVPFSSEHTIPFNRSNILFGPTPPIPSIEKMYTATVKGFQERIEQENARANLSNAEIEIMQAMAEKAVTNSVIN